MKIMTVAALLFCLETARIYASITNSVVVNSYDDQTGKIGIKTNWYVTEMITNWVPAPNYFRTLDGTNYDASHSSQWLKFSDWNGLGVEIIDPNNNGDLNHNVGSIRRIIGGVTFIDISKETMRHETYSGMLYKDGPDEYEKTVVVFNLENPTETKFDFYCTKTTNYIDKNGNVFDAFDCGFPDTNQIPIVTSKRFKISAP